MKIQIFYIFYDISIVIVDILEFFLCKAEDMYQTDNIIIIITGLN